MYKCIFYYVEGQGHMAIVTSYGCVRSNTVYKQKTKSVHKYEIWQMLVFEKNNVIFKVNLKGQGHMVLCHKKRLILRNIVYGYEQIMLTKFNKEKCMSNISFFLSKTMLKVKVIFVKVTWLGVVIKIIVCKDEQNIFTNKRVMSKFYFRTTTQTTQPGNDKTRLFLRYSQAKNDSSYDS